MHVHVHEKWLGDVAELDAKKMKVKVILICFFSCCCSYFSHYSLFLLLLSQVVSLCPFYPCPRPCPYLCPFLYHAYLDLVLKQFAARVRVS